MHCFLNVLWYLFPGTTCENIGRRELDEIDKKKIALFFGLDSDMKVYTYIHICIF